MSHIPRRKLFGSVGFFSLALLLAFSISKLKDRDLPSTSGPSVSSDPASEFQDNIWPFRPPSPWDISTDYPYKRLLEYDVTEGTWLRLDVHPKTGDIVFDMIGDLYCLPASSYASGSQSLTRAIPIMLGIPHDSDPHFSPDGERLVWRSDAELGIENIWVTGWTGCDSMDLRPVQGHAARPELVQALEFKKDDESLLAEGIRETGARRNRRLIREGRIDAQRITNETFRWVTDARFHPSGQRVIATKWYASRGFGAGEGWEYTVPSVNSNHTPISVGSGARRLARTLPLGWVASQYGGQHIGPEQAIWHGDDALIYSKNVIDESGGSFRYSKDVHTGIYAIFSFNLTSQETKTVVSSSPGGASRPELSRDGRTLAFVRRVRDKSVLMFKDLLTGTYHQVYDGLSYDLTTIAAQMGTYPSFAFTPSTNGFEDAVIIWAAGQIRYIPLSTNSRGERVRHPTKQPRIIPFKARIEKRISETLTAGDGDKKKGIIEGLDLVALETKDTMRVSVLKDLRVDESGQQAVFQAAGVTYIQDVAFSNRKDSYRFNHTKRAQKVPVLHPSSPYYSPSFVPGSGNDTLVIHARWSDISFTTLEIANVSSGRAFEVMGLPLGRYYAPAISLPNANTRKLAFIKTAGDLLTGNSVATANPGLYVADIVLPYDVENYDTTRVEMHNVRFVTESLGLGELVEVTKVRWMTVDGKTSDVERQELLLVEQSTSTFAIDIAGGPDDMGNYKRWTIVSGVMANEIVVNSIKSRPSQKCRLWSPLCLWGELYTIPSFARLDDTLATDQDFTADKVAFVDLFQVYLVDGDNLKAGERVWSKPGNASEGLARLSRDGGHDITFSGDGKRAFWFLGPFLHSIEVSHIERCSDAIKADHWTFGIDCVHKQVHVQEVVVEHSTDIARLKQEACQLKASQTPSMQVQDYDTISGPTTPASSNADVLVIYNTTLLTMDTGNVASDVIHDGALVVKAGVIETVGSMQDLVIPVGASVIDAQGAFVTPGFIDVHAHWSGFTTKYPATSWEMETFLAYGITTLHNPSSDNVLGFLERSRVESGQLIGPRIFTVGTIVYGFGELTLPIGVHQDIADTAEARAALVRVKAEGGPASFSYKNYMLPSRASRQRLLLAARNLSMLCVPEGGMNFDWDLTFIVDGMTTVEHALPIPTLYDDVINLFALSGTGDTPTHIVNYGGTWGEQFVWANVDVPNDPKLRRFGRHDMLELLTESTARPLSSYYLFNTSASVAKMVRRGLRAHIGAHGEQPLGLNYHAEMFFTKAGGLSNYEVFRAATSDAAKTLGLQSSIGTLAPGKLADFLIYKPGIDILGGEIDQTQELRYVARGGRVWDASTMEEVWPVQGRKQVNPPLNTD